MLRTGIPSSLTRRCDTWTRPPAYWGAAVLTLPAPWPPWPPWSKGKGCPVTPCARSRQKERTEEAVFWRVYAVRWWLRRGVILVLDLVLVMSGSVWADMSSEIELPKRYENCGVWTILNRSTDEKSHIYGMQAAILPCILITPFPVFQMTWNVLSFGLAPIPICWTKTGTHITAIRSSVWRRRPTAGNGRVVS